jgi:hypothetical protein
MATIRALEEALARAQAEAAREGARVQGLVALRDDQQFAVLDLKEQLRVRAWALAEKTKLLAEAEEANERMCADGEAALDEAREEIDVLEKQVGGLKSDVKAWEKR